MRKEAQRTGSLTDMRDTIHRDLRRAVREYRAPLP